MSLTTNDRRDDGSGTREIDPATQIENFIEEHPLLSLAFMVAVGYAAGRVLSKL